MRRGVTSQSNKILAESYSAWIDGVPFLGGYTTARSTARALIRELRFRREEGRRPLREVTASIKVRVGATAELLPVADYHLEKNGQLWRASAGGRMQVINHAFEAKK